MLQRRYPIQKEIKTTKNPSKTTRKKEKMIKMKKMKRVAPINQILKWNSMKKRIPTENSRN